MRSHWQLAGIATRNRPWWRYRAAGMADSAALIGPTLSSDLVALALLGQCGNCLLHLVAMAVRHEALAEIPLTQWRNASRTNVALTTQR